MRELALIAALCGNAQPTELTLKPGIAYQIIWHQIVMIWVDPPCKYCLILTCYIRIWQTVEQQRTMSTQPMSATRCPALY